VGYQNFLVIKSNLHEQMDHTCDPGSQKQSQVAWVY